MTVLFVRCSPLVAHVLGHEFPEGRIPKNNLIGLYLTRLLSKKSNRFPSSGQECTCTVKVLLQSDERRRHGRWLNTTQSVHLNEFVSKLVREKMHPIITTYLQFDPSMKRAIAYARRACDLPEEVYADDSLSRDYSRWRTRTGKGTEIYKKTVADLS